MGVVAEGVRTDALAREGAMMWWWRWGRVELPVQNLLPKSTTSVADDLSSIRRPSIGTVAPDPVTSPCGLDSELRGTHSKRILAD